MTDRPPTATRSDEDRITAAVRALRALYHLGDNPTQIAIALRVAGFTGCVSSGSRCVIANYLMASGLGVHHVDVLGDQIVLGFSDDHDDVEVIKTPWPIEQFVDAFDKRTWPRLVVDDAAVMEDLNLKVLARFAEELAEADDLQLTHLAQRAEARYASNLGERMRALVDDERARRLVTAALTGGVR